MPHFWAPITTRLGSAPLRARAVGAGDGPGRCRGVRPAALDGGGSEPPWWVAERGAGRWPTRGSAAEGTGGSRRFGGVAHRHEPLGTPALGEDQAQPLGDESPRSSSRPARPAARLGPGRARAPPPLRAGGASSSESVTTSTRPGGSGVRASAVGEHLVDPSLGNVQREHHRARRPALDRLLRRSRPTRAACGRRRAPRRGRSGPGCAAYLRQPARAAAPLARARRRPAPRASAPPRPAPLRGAELTEAVAHAGQRARVEQLVERAPRRRPRVEGEPHARALGEARPRVPDRRSEPAHRGVERWHPEADQLVVGVVARRPRPRRRSPGSSGRSGRWRAGGRRRRGRRGRRRSPRTGPRPGRRRGRPGARRSARPGPGPPRPGRG